MATFVKVCAPADVAPGAGALFTIAGKDIAVFNVDGTFYAIDNTCPHRAGPLAEGEVEGCAVTCPWHAWTFDLKTGESMTDDLKVACYETRVDGDGVHVGV